MAKLFTTPTDIPEGVACRTLKIPNNGIWLGIFNAALLETVNKYNWEQTFPEDMTIEDTIAVCQAIIDEYWIPENCTDGNICLQPDGYRVVRLSATGHYQQLQGGAWEATTGEYAVPPVPERSEPTVYERKCLAAANAAYVLQATYEAVSDAVAEGATAAEAAAIFVATMVLLVGGWIALPLTAIVEALLALFIAFIEIAEFMTADLWNADFTEIVKCQLYACATDTGDVVTFDIQCFNDGLAERIDLLDVTNALNQIRLAGQIQYMLMLIGADGLDAAGATTAIEEADCTCGINCFVIDFKLTDGTEFGFHIQGGSYSSGNGWIGAPQSSGYDAYGYWDFGLDVDAIEVQMTFSKDNSGGANNGNGLYALYPTATSYGTTVFLANTENIDSPLEQGKALDVNNALRGIGFDINTGLAGTTNVTLHSMTVIYTGAIPSGWENNCVPS